MKNLIYLCVIISVALSSCRSNSFTTQKYTKFGHAKHKTATGENLTKTNSPVKNTYASEQLIPTESEILVAASSKETFINTIPQLHLIKSERILNEPSTISSEKIKNGSYNLPVVKKKNADQKSSAAKRIIGTLLKIVLWIIILAVVVGVILIIGALA